MIYWHSDIINLGYQYVNIIVPGLFALILKNNRQGIVLAPVFEHLAEDIRPSDSQEPTPVSHFLTNPMIMYFIRKNQINQDSAKAKSDVLYQFSRV